MSARFGMPAVSSGDFAMAPSGSHVAVCYRVIDLGTQQTSFGHKHQILISWELPEERMDDGRPFSIGKTYTYSSHEKSSLRQDLESWRGAKMTDAQAEQFDLAKLIGQPCMVGITHREGERGTFANVTAVLKLPRGANAPAPENECVCFNLADRPFDHRSFGQLSERLQERIKLSPEYQAAIDGRPLQEEPLLLSENGYGAALDDQIPF